MSAPGVGRDRRLLVVDAGGVLVTEPVPRLLAALADESPLRLDRIEALFAERFYYPLWSGRLSEPEFWSQLVALTGVRSPPERWRRRWLSWLQPLPAMRRLHGWSARTRITVLSNHRSAWLLPLLGEALSAGDVDDVLVSDATGFVKPQPEAFRAVLARAHPARRDTLLVDDRAVNVDAAAACGIPTLLADAPGWVDAVDRWLGG